MGDNQNLTWERIQTSFTSSMSPHDDTYRSKAPGGWLVRYVCSGGAGKTASVIIYTADANYEWTIDEGKELWEPIDIKRTPNDDLKIFRMIIPGGWIVREWYVVSSRQSHEIKIAHLSLSMTFVPDEKHKWMLEKAEKDMQPSDDENNSETSLTWGGDTL